MPVVDKADMDMARKAAVCAGLCKPVAPHNRVDNLAGSHNPGAEMGMVVGHSPADTRIQADNRAADSPEAGKAVEDKAVLLVAAAAQGQTPEQLVPER